MGVAGLSATAVMQRERGLPRAALNDRTLRRLAMRLLLPGLLLNITVANQVWEVGPFYVGQFLFWPLIACAAIVVLLSFGRRSVVPALLIGGLAFSRAIGANQMEGWRYLLYGVPLYGLFAVAGAIVALEARERMRRQLRLYFVLSVPFMLLQVAGAGSWTLALNTETLAVEDWQMGEAKASYPTLFVPPAEARYSIGQSRPAGFMHANNMLSLAIIFALAMQFGRIRSRRVTWTDALFCSAMVLAMAKIVMLSFLVMVGWLLLTGSRTVRVRMRRVFGMTLILYGIYAVLFPGLFLHHFSWFHISYSVMIRVNDFIGTLDPNLAMVRAAATALEDSPQLFDASNPGVAGVLSGYAFIARWLPLLIPLGLLLVIPLRRSYKALRARSREASGVAALVLIGCVLFPAAVPIWRSSVYWYIVGPAIMPMVWHYSRPLRDRIAVESRVSPQPAVPTA